MPTLACLVTVVNYNRKIIITLVLGYILSFGWMSNGQNEIAPIFWSFDSSVKKMKEDARCVYHKTF
jgi:hypothetical protein